MGARMRGRSRAAALVAVAALLAGCGGEAPETAATPGPVLSSLQTIPSPAPPGTAEPNLVTGPDGVYLSWLEETGPDRHALRFARWDGAGWSEPGTIVEREDLFVNWADFPALAVLDDGTLAAHWLQKSGPGTYAYDVRMAVSKDGGESWGADVTAHRDGIEAEHGFASLLPLDGGVGVVWLDGRETVDGNPMTLRFTTLDPDGRPGPEALLDRSTCDCCQTGLAETGAGPIVVYRGRTEEEVRDILITRRVDGEWSAGTPIHDDGWVIPGCPVNGPAVGAAGDRVAVAWFTGAPLDSTAERSAVREAGERGRVLAAFSDDAGATFGPPVRVDDGAAMGRVDLELLPDGTALVVWLERVDGAAEVRVRRVAEDGVGPARPVAGTSAERASGFPRMALRDGRVLFAWTESGESTRVRTAVAETRTTRDAPEDDGGTD